MIKVVCENPLPERHVGTQAQRDKAARAYFDREKCCFCRNLTSFWCKEKDVACCERCARFAKLEDVPSKAEWCRRERIAMKATQLPRTE